MTERFGRADERRKDDETRLKEKQKQWQNSKLYQKEVQKSDQGEFDDVQDPLALEHIFLKISRIFKYRLHF